MDPSEQWKSMTRHHHVTELETERLRDICHAQAAILEKLKAVIPGIDLTAIPAMPPKTPEWKPATYRDAAGNWPSDICKHLDWLSEEDFRGDERRKGQG